MWKIIRWWCVVFSVVCPQRQVVHGLHPPLSVEIPTGGETPREEKHPCHPGHKGPMTEPVKNRIEPDVKQFYVEHEISEREAKVAVRKAELNYELTSEMCDMCGPREIEYCSGDKVINDHCCCDRSDHEFFPYVPHTCYLGNDRCNLVAESCEEYVSLRDCCCSKYLIPKWKSKLIKSNGNIPNQTNWLRILLCVITLGANLFR